MLLGALALALLAVWIALLIRSTKASRLPDPADPGRGRRLNVVFAAATLVAAATSCAAPIVPLVETFDAVANAPPAEKREVLDRGIEGDRPLMPLGVVGLVILVVGVNVTASNARRIRRPPEWARRGTGGGAAPAP